jgi:hypothetical protein
MNSHLPCPAIRHKTDRKGPFSPISDQIPFFPKPARRLGRILSVAKNFDGGERVFMTSARKGHSQIAMFSMAAGPPGRAATVLLLSLTCLLGVSAGNSTLHQTWWRLSSLCFCLAAASTFYPPRQRTVDMLHYFSKEPFDGRPSLDLKGQSCPIPNLFFFSNFNKKEQEINKSSSPPGPYCAMLLHVVPRCAPPELSSTCTDLF